MTIGEWLQSRNPRPPAELMAGLEQALGSALTRDAAEGTSQFLSAAERMLRALVASGQTGRPVAADLLTIDALTTYAVESAAETLDDLPGFAEEAMARFASVIKPAGIPPGST